MADAAVADTHALLLHAAGGQRLGPRAVKHFRATEQEEALVYVPMAVIWELCVLARTGRINLRRPVLDFCDDLFSNPAYQLCDLTLEQIYVAGELGVNRDPFDGLIVTAARHLDLPLLTRDVDIQESGAVQILW